MALASNEMSFVGSKLLTLFGEIRGNAVAEFHFVFMLMI